MKTILNEGIHKLKVYSLKSHISGFSVPNFDDCASTSQPVVVFDSILLSRTAFFLCNSGRVVFHHIVYYCVLHRRHTLLHIWLFLLVLLVQGSHFIFRLVPFKVVDISWDKLPTPKSVVGSILTMVLDVGYLSLSIHHSIWMHIDRCRALPLLHSKFLIT